ncbi:branched-chain amino acid ABC transporter permease [bacterium]|nr:branched-chain amino acid ABC transporter permease [bacterium]
MTQFLQALINGVAIAAVYALIALGFVIIYKSMQVLSFAQPGLLLIGAWWVVFATAPPEEGMPTLFWIVMMAAVTGAIGALFLLSREVVKAAVAKSLFVFMALVAAIDVIWVAWVREGDVGGLGWPFWAGVIFALVIAALTGIAIERGFLRPMVGKPVFAVAIMTIGIDVVLRILAIDLLGINIRSVNDPWGIEVLKVGDLVFQHRQIAQVVTAIIVVILLLAFFKYSRFGLAMRATAFDQEVALTQGVSVSTVFAMSWAIAAVLATIAGVFLGSGFGLSPSAGVTALKALPVVVVGGMDSISGAIFGALLIAVAEQLTVTYQPTYAPWLGQGFAQVVPYLIMFIVLLIRPYGLFGTKEVERV